MNVLDYFRLREIVKEKIEKEMEAKGSPGAFFITIFNDAETLIAEATARGASTVSEKHD